jgi:hypothetical protein
LTAPAKAEPGTDEDRRGSILILGLPYFGRLLEKDLADLGWRAQYLPHPGRSVGGWAKLAPRVATADVLYLIGSRIERGSPQDRMLRLRHKPVVIHWVGTDVLIAREEHAKHRVSLRIAERPIHWCDAPWLVEELRTIGVKAEYVALPIPVAGGRPPPLPEAFRVLLYLPADPFDRGVFDMETILRLPAEFPEIEFILIPSPPETLPPGLPPNLDARGWIDGLDTVYREITVSVRLTNHDGMSFMAIEALSRGRYLIYTNAIPGAIQASGFEQVAAALRLLIAKHEAGALPLNQDGRRWVLSRFNHKRTLAELDERLRGLTA